MWQTVMMLKQLNLSECFAILCFLFLFFYPEVVAVPWNLENEA